MRIQIERELQREEYRSTITISCNDGTKRILNVVGRYNSEMARALGYDLEQQNFKYAIVD